MKETKYASSTTEEASSCVAGSLEIRAMGFKIAKYEISKSDNTELVISASVLINFFIMKVIKASLFSVAIVFAILINVLEFK